MKKEYRVKRNNDIEAIMKKRQSVGNKNFVIYKSENHDQSHFRFAVSVSKKYGNAVKRNKIKRQIREIIANIGVIDPVDFFIVVKVKSAKLSFQDIEQEIKRLMKKLQILR